MKKIAILLIGALFMFTSCEETEAPIYDQSQTLAYFNGTTGSLEVEINDSNTFDIEIGVSTLSSSPRTVTVSVDEANTTVGSEVYSFPSSVTIPANEYFATLTVTATDIGLTTQTETLSLKIDSIDDGGVGSVIPFSLSIVEVCPIPADYMVGMYLISDATAVVGPGNNTENFESGIVEITAGGGTSREFDVAILPAFRGPVTVTINLICNTLVLADVGPSPGITCNGNDPYVFGTAGDDNGLYDLSSDQTFTVFYTEDVEGSCGGPFLSSFTLTKQ